MTERELVRNAARRLAIIRHAEEVTDNVAKTCRYFGITRQSYYVWPTSPTSAPGLASSMPLSSPTCSADTSWVGKSRPISARRWLSTLWKWRSGQEARPTSRVWFITPTVGCRPRYSLHRTAGRRRRGLLGRFPRRLL